MLKILPRISRWSTLKADTLAFNDSDKKLGEYEQLES